MIHQILSLDPVTLATGLCMIAQGAYQGTRRRNAAIAAAKRRHPSNQR